MGELWRKLAALGRRDRLARRMREELEFHAERKAAEEGRSAHEARRAIGNSARILEAADDVWSLGALEHLWADVRCSARAMSKAPAFFLLAAAGVALGVAAITAVWSVAGTVLLRPLPYRDSGRLVIVSDQLLKLGITRFPLSSGNYDDYRAQNRIFEDLAGFAPVTLTVVDGDRAERVPAMAATSNLASLLGLSLAQGRWFTPDETRPGGPDVAVLSYGFRRTHPGRVLHIEDRSVEVIGVLEKGSSLRTGGDAPDVWLPAELNGRARNDENLRAIARLRRGVTVAQAQAAMSALAAELKRLYRIGMGPHGEDGGYQVVVLPLRQELYGRARPTLYALAGASALLLLLGLGNTAMLWLGRGAARRREAALRLALGASRWRVAEQVAVEALLPSLAGGLAALALTLGALGVLNAAPPGEVVAAGRFDIDLTAFAFAMALSAAVGILAGLLTLRPLLDAGTGSAALGQDRGVVADRSENRARPILVALQVGFACALLAPALLLARSLSALEHVDPGFRTGNLRVAWVSLPHHVHGSAGIAAYYRRLESQLESLQGAGNATMVSRLPLSFGEGGDPFSIAGRAFGTSGTMPQFAHLIAVGPNYFRLLRIPIRAGRDFEARDFAETTNFAMVNETLAKAFFPGESALGKRIVMGAPRPGVAWLEIVGVTADVHSGELSRPPLPQVFRPDTQEAMHLTMALIAGGPGFSWEHAVAAVDPSIPVYATKSLQRYVEESLSRPRLRTELFAAYGMLSFALAGFGIYSMAAYAAIRRRREFALRSALGASARQLLGSMLAETLWPAAAGAIAGLAAAYALARGLAAFLYTTGTADAVAYAIALLAALAAAGLSAAWGAKPALTAAPAEVLREE